MKILSAEHGQVIGIACVPVSGQLPSSTACNLYNDLAGYLNGDIVRVGSSLIVELDILRKCKITWRNMELGL